MLSRRLFLAATPASAGAVLYGAQTAPKSRTGARPGPRSHPLDGVARENLKITDLKVTLLSAEIPPERQWYNPRTVAWKSDAVLVQVFTDKGIVGIGEGTPYGGPVAMKKFAEEYARPALLGQNPFDVELLGSGWSGSAAASGSRVWAGIDCAPLGHYRQGERPPGLPPAGHGCPARSTRQALRQRRRRMGLL